MNSFPNASKLRPTIVRYKSAAPGSPRDTPSPNVATKDLFHRKHLPSNCELSLEFIQISTGQAFTVGSNILKVTNANKYMIYEDSFEQLAALAIASITTMPLVSKVVNDGIFSNYNMPVKLCCLGNDALFHRFLCSYVAIHDEGVPNISAVDFQVYIIPTGVNTIAEYLSLHDGWYRRHIFQPIIDPSIFPYVEVPNINKERVNTPINKLLGSPLILTTQLQQEYFRTATFKSCFKIYNCECWVQYDASMPTKHNVVIPFVCKVEIGLNVDVKRYQLHTQTSSDVIIDKYSIEKHYKKAAELKWSSVIQDKAFSRLTCVGVTPDLELTYTKVSMNGTDAEVPVINDITSYGCITLTNTMDNQVAERNSTADPFSQGLELYHLSVSEVI